MPARTRQITPPPSGEAGIRRASSPPRLLERYRTVAVPVLAKELGQKNPMALPRVIKVVVNVGVGKIATDTKKVEAIVQTITRITGQKPIVTKAKKSISNFKIRKGLGIGIVVTLRGRRMYEFLDKLVNVTLPRVRDFHGLPTTAVDARGNYTVAMHEQNVFPEIHSDGLELLHGLQITVCTTATTPSTTLLLLKQLGFPLQVAAP